MNILYLYADNKEEWNCSEWRCAVPMRAINASGKASANMVYIGDWALGKSEVQPITHMADVLVLQRVALAKAFSEIERWKALGKTIILDLDDDYHTMPPSLPSYNFWKNGILESETKRYELSFIPITQLEWATKLVDAITSPSKQILADWNKRNNVCGYLVPNYLEASTYNVERTTTSGSCLTIGWGGSSSHRDSFTDTFVVSALRKVLEKRKVRFRTVGPQRGFIRYLKLPESKCDTVKWGTYANYPKEITAFDIGIAPLAGAYDQRRSWIKGLEYSYVGIPWVCSEGVPYGELNDMGLGKAVKNQTKYWESALLEIIDNYPFEQAKAYENRALVEDLTWEKNVDKVLDTYQYIIDQSREMKTRTFFTPTRVP